MTANLELSRLIEATRDKVFEIARLHHDRHGWERGARDEIQSILTAALQQVSAGLDRLRAPEVTGDTSDGYHTFNELYDYRKAFNALLFNEWAAQGIYDVHKSWRHSDGEPCFGGGWFIVSAQTPTGQVTNHYEASDWDLFHLLERERAEAWDGHTPAMALARLLTLAAVRQAAIVSPSTQTPEKV